MLEKVQRRELNSFQGLEILATKKDWGMWSNNTGDTKIEGDQMEVFKILNVRENIDPNIFFKIKAGKITSYWKGRIDSILESTSKEPVHTRPNLGATHCQRSDTNHTWKHRNLLLRIACGELPVFRKKTKDNRTWVADQEPVNVKRLEPWNRLTIWA